jgi:selenocysteine lyase/cysteine desulfurase
MDIGILTIERWTLHLTELLIADIQQRGYELVSNLLPQRRSAIVALRVAGDADATLRRLTDAKIMISKHRQVIRVSPHCYNTEEEIARVGEVLGRAIHGTQPTGF